MISKVKQCVSLDFVMEAKNYASLFGIMLVDRRNGHKLGQTSRDGGFLQWSCTDVRVGSLRKLSGEELILLNCGVREDS